jgi:hypothetical protein
MLTAANVHDKHLLHGEGRRVCGASAYASQKAAYSPERVIRCSTTPVIRKALLRVMSKGVIPSLLAQCCSGGKASNE